MEAADTAGVKWWLFQTTIELITPSPEEVYVTRRDSGTLKNAFKETKKGKSTSFPEIENQISLWLPDLIFNTKVER